jgi:hypothetical protein
MRRAHLLAASVAIAAAVAVAAVAQAQCPAEGDCREPHDTPGCVMPDCCALVCEVNPLCCEIAWDESCVDIALDLCEGINCPAEGACDAAHPSPGCDDYLCCDLVDALDGWCGGVSWDEACAREAVALCGVAPCTIDLAGAPDEEEPCYERLNDGWGVGTPATRIGLACGGRLSGRCVGGGPRDTDWFALDGVDRRRFRVEFESEFPAQLLLLSGDEEGPNETQWLVGLANCAGPHTFTFLVDGGVSSLVLGSGNDDRAIRGGLQCPEFDPENPPEPDDPLPVQRFGLAWRIGLSCLPRADVNGDGAVNAQDLGLVLGAWGAVDPSLAVDPRAPSADLDGDGTVNAQDLAEVLGSWTGAPGG